MIDILMKIFQVQDAIVLHFLNTIQNCYVMQTICFGHSIPQLHRFIQFTYSGCAVLTDCALLKSKLSFSSSQYFKLLCEKLNLHFAEKIDHGLPIIEIGGSHPCQIHQ